MSVVLLRTLLLLLLFGSVSHTQELKYSGTMGYLLDGMNDARYKDAQLAFDIWVQELADDEGIETHIEYYESDEKIIEDFKAERIDLLVLNAYYYLKHRKTIEKYSKDLWAVEREVSVFEKMVVLVRKDSGIKILSDLEQKRVMARSDDYLGKMILNTELLREVHTKADDHVDAIIDTEKFSTAILKTFFGKVDACIVPENSFLLANEMNPALGKELMVIFKSDAIHTPTLSVYYQRSDDGLVAAFKRNVAKLDKTVRGQNILDLFKMKKILQIEHEDLGPLIAYYQEYLRLKALYGVQDE